MTEKTEAEVVRLTQLLASAIHFSGRKQRSVEKALGMSSGIMSRVLNGGIELKVRHVLEICELLGFPPACFFHASYPVAEKGGNDAAHLQRLLEQLHPAAQAAPEPSATAQPAPASTVHPDEIERMVFEVLAKLFSNPGGGGGTG